MPTKGAADNFGRPSITYADNLDKVLFHKTGNTAQTQKNINNLVTIIIQSNLYTYILYNNKIRYNKI